MQPQFQFSLARLLGAMALLCVAITLGRAAVLADDTGDGELLMIAAGVCAIAIPGVLVRRFLWLAAGAFIVAVLMLGRLAYEAFLSAS